MDNLNISVPFVVDMFQHYTIGYKEPENEQEQARNKKVQEQARKLFETHYNLSPDKTKIRRVIMELHTKNREINYTCLTFLGIYNDRPQPLRLLDSNTALTGFLSRKKYPFTFLTECRKQFLNSIDSLTTYLDTYPTGNPETDCLYFSLVPFVDYEQSHRATEQEFNDLRTGLNKSVVFTDTAPALLPAQTGQHIKITIGLEHPKTQKRIITKVLPLSESKYLCYLL